MRYVLVPVPSEHVLEVMRWVLFRSNENVSPIRDAAALAKVVEEADAPTRAMLDLVATATLDDKPLRLTEAADELDLSQEAATGVLAALNRYALTGDRALIKTSHEIAVGVHGNRGEVSYLAMRPAHARLLRGYLRSTAPSA
jgi:hypothetical protein